MNPWLNLVNLSITVSTLTSISRWIYIIVKLLRRVLKIIERKYVLSDLRSEKVLSIIAVLSSRVAKAFDKIFTFG